MDEELNCQFLRAGDRDQTKLTLIAPSQPKSACSVCPGSTGMGVTQAPVPRMDQLLFRTVVWENILGGCARFTGQSAPHLKMSNIFDKK